MRFGLNAMILACRFSFRQSFEAVVALERRRRFGPGRVIDEPRGFAFRFECLAKISVKD
jgi:hypothetical protein